MTLTKTSNRPLRLALEAEMMAIVPTHEPQRDQRWQIEETHGHVMTGGVRHYYMELGSPEQRVEGVQGGAGLEYEQQLIILTSYGALSRTEASDMMADDNNDLLDVLRIAGVEGRITGLIDVTEPDVALIQDDDNVVLAEHTFTVRALRQNRK